MQISSFAFVGPSHTYTTFILFFIFGLLFYLKVYHRDCTNAGFLIMCTAHSILLMRISFIYLSGLQKRGYEFTFSENLINRRDKRNAYNRFAQIELVGDSNVIPAFVNLHISLRFPIVNRERNVCVHVQCT